MRRLVALAVAVLWLVAVMLGPPASAEQVVETWRSPFGVFRGMSVNAADGSCWVSSGTRVFHLGPAGEVLAEVSGLAQPTGVAVNASDGSCWVAEMGQDRLVRLAGDGAVLATAADLVAGLLAVNPTDGSCTATIKVQEPDPPYYEHPAVVCVAGDGTERWRIETGRVYALAASPADDSWWLLEEGDVVRLHADGSAAWRTSLGGTRLGPTPMSLSVSSADGTAWVANDNGMFHLTADGAELAHLSAWDARTVSVDSSDGSIWIRQTNTSSLLHLSEDGNEVLAAADFAPGALDLPAASPADGSCWVMASATRRDFHFLSLLESPAVVHVAADGTVRWRADSSRPTYLATSAYDGSCWVAYDWDPCTSGDGWGLVHLTQDGTEVQRIGGLDIRGVAVNEADGSAWVLASAEVRHLSPDGDELLRLDSFPYTNDLAVNPADGSCWIVAGLNAVYVDQRYGEEWPGEVIHVAEDGTTLLRLGGFEQPEVVSVDPRDGSCWLVDPATLIHLAEDGGELFRTGGWFDGHAYWSVTVDPRDGSCWAVGRPTTLPAFKAHLASDGAVLSWTDGYYGGPISVNAYDGSCWMVNRGEDWPDHVVHVSPDGEEVWASVPLPDRYPFSWHGVFLSVNAADGSCWVADRGNGEVARYAIVGYTAWPFSDVPADYWAFDAIAACVDAGMVQGYGDNTYLPELPVTRDQMAVYISRGLAGSDEAVTVPTGVAEPSFTDVGEDHWAYRHIEYCVGANIVEGYPDGGYHPDEVVNRGQMAVYIARTLVTPSGDAGIPHFDEPVVLTSIMMPGFSDVTPDNEWAWCYDHVMYCVEQGVVQGYPDAGDGNVIRYHPEFAVTRDQMAVFAARTFGLGQE